MSVTHTGMRAENGGAWAPPPPPVCHCPKAAGCMCIEAGHRLGVHAPAAGTQWSLAAKERPWATDDRFQRRLEWEGQWDGPWPRGECAGQRAGFHVHLPPQPLAQGLAHTTCSVDVSKYSCACMYSGMRTYMSKCNTSRTWGGHSAACAANSQKQMKRAGLGGIGAWWGVW